MDLDRTPYLEELRVAIIPRLRNYEEQLATYLGHLPQQPLRVLAVDPGTTNIALCFLDLEHEGVLTSKVDPPDVTTIGANVRYRELVLEHWITLFRPEVIFKEGVAHGAEFGVAEAGRLQYMIERVSMEHGIPCFTINTHTMRAFIGASGKGKDKSDIKLQVFKRFGREFTSQDETDAFAIAQTGLALVRGDIDPKGKKVKK